MDKKEITKKLLFYFILVIIIFFSSIVIIILSLMVYETAVLKYYGDYDKDIFIKDGDNYITTRSWSIRETFLIEKPNDTFRIFVLGGSQAMGTPYVHQVNSLINEFEGILNMPNEGGISTWIEEYLTKIYPSKNIEVINVAVGGGDISYVDELVDEIALKGSADLLLILSGNNERNNSFLEKSMDDITQEDFEITFQQVTERYIGYMDAIVEKIHQYDLKALIMTVPTNLRNTLPDDKTLYGKGFVDDMVEAEEFQSCINKLQEFDDTNANKHFDLGRCYLGLDMLQEAKFHFSEARDLDKGFYRARSDWNNHILGIEQDENVKTYDLEKEIMAYSRYGIAGSDLFVDNCHLKLLGYQMMAKMITRNILEFSFDPGKVNHIQLSEIEPKQLRTLYMLKILKWFRIGMMNFGLDSNDKANLDNYMDEYRQINIHISNIKQES